MTQSKMERTLKALYEFIASNYENLKSDWNKLPKSDKQRLPLPLFCIVVFAELMANTGEKINETIKNKGNDESVQEAQVEGGA